MSTEPSTKRQRKAKAKKWTRVKTRIRPVEDEVDEALSKIYYNFGSEGALTNTPELLIKIARNQLPKRLIKRLSLKRIQTFLSRQASYTVHRRFAKKQFPRRRIRLTHKGGRFEGDLVELQDLSSKNNGFKYILVVIDAFSKYVWAEPQKNKESLTTRNAFDKILENGYIPQVLYTDAGKEFVGGPFQTLLRLKKIVHRICGGESFHCPFVERVNRTIKEKLFQAMTATHSQRWVDLLPKIISTYNSTTHSTTGFAPKHVKSTNALTVYNNIYSKPPKPPKKYKYKIGDYVRIAKAQDAFSRGYLPRFTWEIFQIAKLADDHNKPGNPPGYILRDLNGQVIEHALFYEPELSLVDPQLVHGPRAIFPIHQVIGRRTTRDGKREVQVWFKGWKKEDAEWIPESQIKVGGEKEI